MEPSRWQQIKELFAEAAELAVTDRHQFLKQKCGSDVELRREVSDLLGVTQSDLSHIAHSAAKSYINESVKYPNQQEIIGSQLGAYVITGLIGEGGMGTVFKAKRADDEYQQQVAIKLIRSHLANQKLIERFQSERQILANLNHPNIASLIDGGRNEEGMPFIVMEYVDGLPILEYCKVHRLNIHHKIELFKQVANAIIYAHQNLIVHRDVKPENILVTKKSSVKLLDFGIAKIISSDLIFDGDITHVNERALTPYYASPEQLTGKSVSTRTDVYSLGVLLFQLLSGVNPYYRVEKVPASVIKAICETDPMRPSVAVADTTKNEKSEVKIGESESYSLVNENTKKILQGELDSIVLKAMQRETASRYQSVENLLQDLNSYQNQRPISAQVDSWHYRSGKFIRRNKLSVISISIIFILTLSSAILFSLQSIKLKQQKIKAELEASVANQTSNFLIDLFRTADPRHAGTQFVTARELLGSAVKALKQGKIKDPATRARLLLNLGLAYQHLDDEGTNELGLAAMKESLALTEEIFGRRSLQTAEVLQRLGDAVRESTSNAQDAFDLIKEGLGIRLELIPELTIDIGDSYNNLALAIYDRGKIKEAERLHKLSNSILAKLSKPDANNITNLGYVFEQRGLFTEAIAQADVAINLLRGSDNNADGLRNNLFLKARSYRELGRFQKALSLLEDIAPLDLILYGPNHTKPFFRKREIAQTLHASGKLKEAEKIYLSLEKELIEKHIESSSYYDFYYVHYGLLLVDLGRLDEGAKLFEKGYKRRETRWGSASPLIDSFKITLAIMQIEQGKYSQAEKAFSQVLIKYDGIQRDPDLDMARILSGLAKLDLVKGENDLASEKLSHAIEILKNLGLRNYSLTNELIALQSSLLLRGE